MAYVNYVPLQSGVFLPPSSPVIHTPVQAAVQGPTLAMPVPPMMPVPLICPFMNQPMLSFPTLPHWLPSFPLMGSYIVSGAPVPHFHAHQQFQPSAPASVSTVGTALPLGSMATISSGEGVIHGALPWPNPYLLARDVPRASSLFMPELHSSTPGIQQSSWEAKHSLSTDVAVENRPALTSTIASSHVEMSSAPVNEPVAQAEEDEEIIQFNKVSAKPSRQTMSSMVPAPAAVPEPQEPREAGVGLMFVVAAPPKKGWAVKNIVNQSPADLSGKIQEGHCLTAVDGNDVTEIKSLGKLSKLLMGTEGTSTVLTFKSGSGKKAKSQHVTLIRSNAFLGEDGGNKDRRWKATRTDWIDSAQAVDL